MWNLLQFTNNKFAIISVLFRQTSIIWMFWIAANHILQMHEQDAQQQSLVWYLWHNKWQWLRETFGFVLVAIAFVTFALVNNGIAVGRKKFEYSSHKQ